MSGLVSIDVDTRPLLKKLRELQPILRKDMRTLTKQAARLFVKNVVKISPPGGSRSKFDTNPERVIQKSSEAKARGVSAIRTDIFGGNRSGGGTKAGKRPGIFTTMSSGMLAVKARQFNTMGEHSNEMGAEKLWVNKDGRVYAVESTLYRPNASAGEMMRHHKRYWKNGRISTAGTYTRDIGRWRFIDKMVITKTAAGEIMKTLARRVGYFASGWKAAANKLGLSLPKWISDKDGQGGCWEKESSSGFSVTIANKVSYRQAMQVDRLCADTLKFVEQNFVIQAEKIKAAAVKKAGFSA